MISSALSGDGNTLAVGATGEDSTATGVDGNQSFVEGSSAENSGAVYVFSRRGTDWQQQAYIKASTIQPTGFFGRAISLSGSESAAIGINGDQSDTSAPFAGAVFCLHVMTKVGINTLMLQPVPQAGIILVKPLV